MAEIVKEHLEPFAWQIIVSPQTVQQQDNVFTDINDLRVYSVTYIYVL